MSLEGCALPKQTSLALRPGDDEKEKKKLPLNHPHRHTLPPPHPFPVDQPQRTKKTQTHKTAQNIPNTKTHTSSCGEGPTGAAPRLCATPATTLEGLRLPSPASPPPAAYAASSSAAAPPAADHAASPTGTRAPTGVVASTGPAGTAPPRARRRCDRRRLGWLSSQRRSFKVCSSRAMQ